MSEEYVIAEDEYYEDGDGTKAYIKDGQLVVDVVCQNGYDGGCWFCDIDLLKQHIAKYEQELVK